MGHIILGGERFPCDAPVLTWEDHGLEFKAGRGARRQIQEIDLFVMHWTGGENEPPRMFDVLERRKLAVEFAISGHEAIPGYALIWQFCDPILTDAFQAGKVNRRSMGCEVINYGFRRLKNLHRIPRAGRDRETYPTRWNGRKRTFARFRPHQLHSALALVEAVIRSGTTKIEAAIPARGGEPLARVMTAAELARFSGVLGHNHVGRRKSDPGTDLIAMLSANEYRLQEVAV